jgi:hypothetical protein
MPDTPATLSAIKTSPTGRRTEEPGPAAYHPWETSAGDAGGPGLPWEGVASYDSGRWGGFPERGATVGAARSGWGSGDGLHVVRVSYAVADSEE